MSTIHFGDNEKKQTHGHNTGSAGKKNNFSASDLGSFFGAEGISARETTEVVSKFMEAMTEVIKASSITGVTLVPIDGTSANLNISAIAVATKVESELLVYTMFLEATGPGQGQLADRVVPLQRNNYAQVSIPSVTGDLIDNDTLARVAATVKAYVKHNGEMVSVGTHVIHRELAMDVESTFKYAVRQHLRTALNALISERNIITDNETVFCLTQWSNNIFACRSEGATHHSLDNSGLPSRQDLSISLTVIDPAKGHGNQAVANSNELGRSAGYPELRFTGLIPGVMVINPANGLPMPAKCQFQPRFVITDTQLETRTFNYQLQLLTLAMTTLFNRNKAWMAAYRPQFLSGGTASKFRDISALAHEIHEPIDLKTTDIQAVLSTYCHDSMQYVIHVPETGETTWFQNLLREVAANVGDARAAYIQHADALTNGQFSKLVDPKDPLVVMEQDRVILGYYVDSEGDRRDLREIDYLAILNMVGATDMPLVERFDNTFNPNTGDVEVRLSERVKILQHIFRDNMVIKGYATPLILTASHLEALWQAIRKCGVDPRTSGDFEYRTTTRGNQGAMEWAMPGHVMSGYAQYGTAHTTTHYAPQWTGMHTRF